MKFNLFMLQIKEKKIFAISWLFLYALVLIIYLYSLSVQKVNNPIEFMNFFQNGVVVSSLIIPFYLYTIYKFFIIPSNFQLIRIKNKKTVIYANVILAVVISFVLSHFTIAIGMLFKFLSREPFFVINVPDFLLVNMISSMTLFFSLLFIGVLFILLSALSNLYIAPIFVIISLAIMISYSNSNFFLYVKSVYLFTFKDPINVYHMFIYSVRLLFICICLLILIQFVSEKKEFIKKREKNVKKIF